MAKTTITVETPIEDCGLTCPHFKVNASEMIRNGLKFFGVFRCEHYDSCEEALYQAGVLKDADDEEDEEGVEEDKEFTAINTLIDQLYPVGYRHIKELFSFNPNEAFEGTRWLLKGRYWERIK